MASHRSSLHRVSWSRCGPYALLEDDAGRGGFNELVGYVDRLVLDRPTCRLVEAECRVERDIAGVKGPEHARHGRLPTETGMGGDTVGAVPHPAEAEVIGPFVWKMFCLTGRPG